MSREEDRDDRGFRVTDRRIRFDDPGDGQSPPTDPDAAAASAGEDAAARAPEVPPDAGAGQGVVEGPGWQMEKKPGAGEERAALPPMDFTQLCLSMASSVLIHLGEANDPETGAPRIDLPLAKQTIDVLSMLEEKTRGNLTDAEARLLSTVLYDLRMRFLQRSKKA